MKPIIILAAAIMSFNARAVGMLDPTLQETRFCGTPKRQEDGKILRRASVMEAFQRKHPCPSTGKGAGACPGWAIDHVIPLASCGCDAVFNMQWLPNEIKSAAGAVAKDRWERRYYRCEQAAE